MGSVGGSIREEGYQPLKKSIRGIRQKMPEIEKQTSTVQEGDSNVKPGGLIFEVVLDGPKTDEKPNLRCPPTPILSAEDIERKLKDVTDRRKSMEASTMEKLAEKEKRAEEVRAKKVRAKKASMPQ